MMSSMEKSQGAQLARLLLGSFNAMVEEVIVALESRGHPGVRASHEFALQVIADGADTASELGRRLAVSKQAAAKTIATLEQMGYVTHEVDPSDKRSNRLRVTPRGYELSTVGAILFNEVRDRWAAQIGTSNLEALEAHLAQLTERRLVRADDLIQFEGEAIE